MWQLDARRGTHLDLVHLETHDRHGAAVISLSHVGGQLHRVLLMSLLIGATFMIWVDVLAHSLLQDQVLPVGIVTSALGSLFFFIILKQRQSR